MRANNFLFKKIISEFFLNYPVSSSMGNSLQCRHILSARVHIFVLGRSLDSVTVGDWGEEIFAEAV